MHDALYQLYHRRIDPLPTSHKSGAVAGKRSYASQTIPVFVVIETILLDYNLQFHINPESHPFQATAGLHR